MDKLDTDKGMRKSFKSREVSKYSPADAVIQSDFLMFLDA